MSSPVHIICIGSELLNGRTLNSNLCFLGGALAGIGVRIARESCVDDDPAAIAHALTDAAAAGELIICVGGLGPTTDDLTRESVSAHLGLPMHHDDAVYGHIAAIYARRGREPGPGAVRMALVPAGAAILPNPNGTAVGLWCPGASGGVILLPGPPNELRPMVMDHVLPRLAAENRGWTTCTASIFGIAESDIQAMIGDCASSRPDIELAYRLDFGRCELRFSGPSEATAQLLAARDEAIARVGRDAVAGDLSLPLAVVQLVRQRGGLLAATESCTGGLIGAAITDWPGVSDVFLGSAVTYANSWKEALLGVPAELLAAHGAVSPETAEAMAVGVCRNYGATCALAVTGIAGPDGGSVEKPVGLVYIATVVDGIVRVQRQHFHGSREVIRSRTAANALNQLRRQLLDQADSP